MCRNNLKSVVARCVPGGSILAFVILAIALPLPIFSATSQPSVFYAIGSDELGQGTRLYEINSATLRVLQSLNVERQTPGYGSGTVGMQSGMLTPTHDAILLTDGDLGDSVIMRVTAPRLMVVGLISLKSLRRIQGIQCFDHIFIHPVTGLAYISCDSGKRGNGFTVLDVLNKSVVADFADVPPEPSGWPVLSIYRPQFAYARDSRRLYLISDDIMVLDPQNHPVDYILARDVAAAAGRRDFTRVRYTTKSLAVLPQGRLAILIADSQTPSLVIYDSLQRKGVAHWTETRKYTALETYTDRSSGKKYEKPVQRTAELRCGPVPSFDDTRLFALSRDEVIVWDTSTLKELGRFQVPGPAGKETNSCLYPAPDGHGIWFVSESGKVYRLDDHTGHLMEEVKLPFRLLTLIQEP